jgi:cytoskeletal protein RodZ
MMLMQSLTIIVLLCYLMLLAASLMVWFALTMRHAPQARKEAARAPKPAAEPAKPQLPSSRETARSDTPRTETTRSETARTTAGRPTESRPEPRPEPRSEPQHPAATTVNASTSTPPNPPRLNNDQVRGAWAGDNRKSNPGEGDPFERFIRSKNDDMSF